MAWRLRAFGCAVPAMWAFQRRPCSSTVGGPCLTLPAEWERLSGSEPPGLLLGDRLAWATWGQFAQVGLCSPQRLARQAVPAPTGPMD